VILVGATVFPRRFLALRGVPVEFDDTSLLLGVVVCMEEESDLVRLALGGLTVRFSNSELGGGVDEDEDRVDLLHVNAVSKSLFFLEDPRD
jgi:hypothetical protein